LKAEGEEGAREKDKGARAVPLWRGQGEEEKLKAIIRVVGIFYKTISEPISFQHTDIIKYNVTLPLSRPINGLFIVGIIYKMASSTGR